MKVLLTSIGRRVQLISHLKKKFHVIGVDSSEDVSAANFVDEFSLVPRFNETAYIENLLHLCRNKKIDLLVPIHEAEFDLICDNRSKFIDNGTVVLLSDKKTINIFKDKWETYKFFISNGVKTPATFEKQGLPGRLSFPYIIKPRFGMGSRDVFKINNKIELDFFINYVEDPILQEFVEGREFTIDVLYSLNSEIISIVPRERLEVRSGEVSKSRTVRNMELIERTKELCKKIQGIGPMTIQCFLRDSGDIIFTEINPRFGGGVPLTFEAGVDYSRYFVRMLKGEALKPAIGEFKEITMLRYDEAVYKSQ